MLDISKFGKGAIIRGPDPRDIIYSDYIAGASPVDWDVPYDVRDEIGELKVNNQGWSLTCVGQACSKLAEILNLFEVKRIMQYVWLSARDVYSRIFVPEGGAYGYKGLSKIVERGVAAENIVSSYENGNPPSEQFMRIQDNSQVATDSAIIHKANHYAHVSQNIDEMALAIRNQKGIVFGVIGTNQGWGSGFIPNWPQTGEEVWYHFIVGVGYKRIGGKKYIVILNSWGSEWGDAGYGYISEDYIARGWTFNAMTLIDLPNPPEKIYMKDLVMLEGTSDQYVVSSGRKLKIPDIETRDFLRDELELITGDPRIVKQAEFDSFATGSSMPSVKGDQLIKDFYNFYQDKLPALQDIVDAE